MTEVRTTSSTGGEKGVKEERYDLIPVDALATVAKLYGFGAKKYAEHNWRRGYEWSKSYAALSRHLNEFWKGVDLDPETGLPHLAAVIFHSMTLMTFMEEQRLFDDRFIGPKTEIDTIVEDMNRGIISREDARANLGLKPEASPETDSVAEYDLLKGKLRGGSRLTETELRRYRHLRDLFEVEAPKIEVHMSSTATPNADAIYKQTQDQIRLAHRSSQS